MISSRSPSLTNIPSPYVDMFPLCTYNTTRSISLYQKCLFTCPPFLLSIFYESRNQVHLTPQCLPVLISVHATHSRNDKNEWMNEQVRWVFKPIWSCIWAKLVGVKSFVYSRLCDDPRRITAFLSFHSCLQLVCLVFSSSMKFCSVKYSNSPLLSSRRLFHTLSIGLALLILSLQISSSTDWFYFS